MLKDQSFVSSINDRGSVKQVSMKLYVSEDVIIEYLVQDLNQSGKPNLKAVG